MEARTHAVEYIYEGAVGQHPSIVIDAAGQPEISVADPRPLALFSASEVDNTGRSLPKFQAVPYNKIATDSQPASKWQRSVNNSQSADNVGMSDGGHDPAKKTSGIW